jgi:hypothetical protein
MAMQTDVLASHPLTSAGQALDQNSLVIGRARVKAVYIIPTASAGSVVFRDGGSGGAVKATINTLASSTAPNYMLLPGEGLLFQTNIYIAPTAVVSTTVIYG